MALAVNEIFYSLQGESSYAGFPCVFVRLCGCNLRCSYCDTTYAYQEGRAQEIETIIQTVAAFRCPLVEITGGEPLIQEQTPALIRKSLEQGWRVLLETNGSIDISPVDSRCIRIVDVKCPSSGQQEKNDLENLNRLSAHDEVKFVIGDRADYRFAREIFRACLGRGHTVHFSPVFSVLAPAQLAEWILADRLNVRLQLQLHKMLWHPDRRGV